MTLENLKNKPLIEAIFDIRWYIKQQNQRSIDPNTPLILGRLFDRINSEYPKYEQLPSSVVPDNMAEGLVKHRFRSEKDWPLVQLGTGILTVNDTENYQWKVFKKRIIDVVNQLYIIHPSNEKFTPRQVLLKYIDAVDLEFEENVYKFLQDKMKINLSLNPSLFEKNLIDANPIQFDLQFAFKSSKPKGTVNFRLFKGQKANNQDKETTDALIWETTIQSLESDVPQIPFHLDTWLEDAHSVAHDWFFTLIEGDLLRRFE
ncbi:MAG: TIGR04255 family protein [Calothrix sp. MO_192.B10]|nr:TIGR04255 family protein [Calothrix sp. MO_192.B10]